MTWWLWVALASALGGEGGEDLPGYVEPDADAGPLEARSYRFCHQAGVDPVEVAAWCELLAQQPSEVCPGMRETCAHLDDPVELPKGGCNGEDEPPVVVAPLSEPNKPKTKALEAPIQGCDCGPAPDLSFLSVFMRWLVAAGVAVVLVVIVRFALERLQREAPRDHGQVRDAPPPPAAAIEGDDDLPMLPEDELLGFARQALAEGRLGDAALYARGAALRRLARRGLVRLHRARTDREYLRAVQPEPETASLLRAVLHAVEDLRWAGRRLNREGAERAVEAAGRILAVALAALVFVTPANGASRYGPFGDAAFYDLYEEAGFEVTAYGGRIGDVTDEVDVLILDPTRVPLEDSDLAGLVRWVEEGGVLIQVWSDAAPWQVSRSPTPTPGETVETAGAPDLLAAPEGPWTNYRLCGGSKLVWFAEDLLATEDDGAGSDSDEAVEELGEDEQVDTDAASAEEGEDIRVNGVGEGIPPIKLTRKQRREMRRLGLDPQHLDEIVPPPSEIEPDEGACELSLAVWRSQGTGAVVLISDAALLRNAALISAANRQFLTDLPEFGATDGRWTVRPTRRLALALAVGRADDNPFRSIANLRLLPFVLHLLLLWGLAAWWRGMPFAMPREPVAAGRRAFSEHARALGRGWMAAGGVRHAASAFAKLWIGRLDRKGVEHAAVRRGYPAKRAADFADAVADLAAHPDGPPRGDEARVVEELWNVTRGGKSP